MSNNHNKSNVGGAWKWNIAMFFLFNSVLFALLHTTFLLPLIRTITPSCIEFFFLPEYQPSSLFLQFSAVYFPSNLNELLQSYTEWFKTLDQLEYFIVVCSISFMFVLFRFCVTPLRYSRSLHDLHPSGKKKIAGKTPPEYPNAWYHLLSSSELKVGESVSVDLLGHRLVVYRTKDAKKEAVVLDAFCPHLGADLSEGKVIGNCIECPFHGWRFDPSGKCVKIAYQNPLHPDYARSVALHPQLLRDKPSPTSLSPTPSPLSPSSSPPNKQPQSSVDHQNNNNNIITPSSTSSSSKRISSSSANAINDNHNNNNSKNSNNSSNNNSNNSSNNSSNNKVNQKDGKSQQIGGSNNNLKGGNGGGGSKVGKMVSSIISSTKSRKGGDDSSNQNGGGSNNNLIEDEGDIPGTARTNSWITREFNGHIYIWYHAGGNQPTWQPPKLPQYNGAAKFHGRSSHMVATHIQEIPENGADSAHLFYLHPPFVVPLIGMFFRLSHRWRTQWVPGNSQHTLHTAKVELEHQVVVFNRWRIPGSYVLVNVSMIGPSIVYIQFQTLFGKIYAMQTITPVETELQHCIHEIWADWSVPRPIVKLALYAVIVQFERDVLVWNAKIHKYRPILVRGDGKIMQFRRWFSQFYSKESYESLSW